MSAGDGRIRVAWARYGENGFMLAGSLSLTHVAQPGTGRTRCGARIPERRSDATIVYGHAAGRGRCKRCER